MQTGLAGPIQSGPSSAPLHAAAKTRLLLLCGVVAGPLYVVVGLVQALTRDGFDITRHALSLLSNGPLGWIQISNFVVTGLLVIACAIGIRKTLKSDSLSGATAGRLWGPLLLGVYGLGLIAAGIFVADPALGFPPGTPEGPPHNITGHGLRHFVSGGVGFLGLIASCFVFARRFAAVQQPAWAAYSLATGLIFFAAFFAIASGSGKVWINLAFCFAVVLAWAWITAVAARTLAELKS
jgi:Protein of unknown function (DUF998)